MESLVARQTQPTSDALDLLVRFIAPAAPCERGGLRTMGTWHTGTRELHLVESPFVTSMAGIAWTFAHEIGHALEPAVGWIDTAWPRSSPGVDLLRYPGLAPDKSESRSDANAVGEPDAEALEHDLRERARTLEQEAFADWFAQRLVKQVPVEADASSKLPWAEEVNNALPRVMTERLANRWGMWLGLSGCIGPLSYFTARCDAFDRQLERRFARIVDVRTMRPTVRRRSRRGSSTSWLAGSPGV